MTYWKEKTVISAIVLLATVSAFEFSSVKHNFPKKQVLMSEESLKNTTYLYAVCDKPGKTAQKICDIRLETLMPGNMTDSRNCHVTLTAAPHKVVNEAMKLVQVGKHEAVLLWMNVDPDSLSSTEDEIQLANVYLVDCRITQAKAKLPFALETSSLNVSLRVIGYKNTYDIVFEESFYNGSISKGTYDMEGKVINEVALWEKVELDTILDIQSVKCHSADKGLVILQLHQGYVELLLVKDDAKLLKKWSIQSSATSRLSIVYDTIGVCIQDNDSKILECGFFNLDGKLKHESKFHPDSESPTILINAHNLPAGFILLKGDCLQPGYEFGRCTENSRSAMRYNVTSLHTNKLAGNVPLSGYTLQRDFDYFYLDMFERAEDGTHCMSYVDFANDKLNQSAYVHAQFECFRV